MSPDDIRIVHVIPWPIRLKVIQDRENQALTNQRQQRLVSLPGVHSVSVNILTGSVLILHTGNGVDPQEFQRAFAEPLTTLFPGSPPVDFASCSSPGAHGLASQVTPLSAHVRAFFCALSGMTPPLTREGKGALGIERCVDLLCF
jgi:heavy-metal-associated domain-containing protein